MKCMQLLFFCVAITICEAKNDKQNEDTVSLDTISSEIQKTNTVMDGLKLTKEFERFDEAKFGHLIKSGNYRGALNEDYFIELLRGKEELYYYLYHVDSYFKLTRAYFANGNIKFKGLHFNYHSFPKGVWRFFNEQGEVIREVDYDAPFQFTFEDVLRFCEKEGIAVDKGYIPQGSGFHTCVYRKESDGECWWKIEHLKAISTIEVIHLDGKTGRVISRLEYEYINN